MKTKQLHIKHTSDIVEDTIRIVRDSREAAYRSINYALLERNWLIGKRIAEEELYEDHSDNYGKEIVQTISARLTDLFGKGFSQRNLYAFVEFYKLSPKILQSVIAKSPVLSWTHYYQLLRVLDDDAREWYHQQALDENWCVRILDRNIATQYYYRILQSPKPKTVEAEMKEKTAAFQNNSVLEFIKNLSLTDTGAPRLFSPLTQVPFPFSLSRSVLLLSYYGA